MARVKLVRIAHARSGDKGDTANVGLIALKPEYLSVVGGKSHRGAREETLRGNLPGRGGTLRAAESGRAQLPAARKPGWRRHALAQGRRAGKNLQRRAAAEWRLTFPTIFSNASYQKILYTVEQSVARVTLNRPEKRNALDAELIVRSSGCAARLRARRKCPRGFDHRSRRRLLFGSRPERPGTQFNAGVLDHMADARNMAELFVEMRHHPRPIVAAVHGRALAGGCGLATACDLILAAESAKFGYPEVNIGFVPAMVMAILRRSLSEKRAFEMIATGEIISAQTRSDFDLINAIFADETFDARCGGFCFASSLRSRRPPSRSRNGCCITWTG